MKSLKIHTDTLKSLRRSFYKDYTRYTINTVTPDYFPNCLYFQFFETQVFVRCRVQDRPIVESILPEIIDTYKRETGKDISLKVEPDNSLPADSCGGIELLALKGKIKINNTLESRLELIAQQLVPQIRVALFGRNPNRKFTD